VQQAVDLVGHLVWSVTLLVVFVMLRRQFRQAADAIGKRSVTGTPISRSPARACRCRAGWRR
jgi:hypothetical protein